MLSPFPEVSLEVVGLGVVAAYYSGFLLRRWWISRNAQARALSPSGEAVADKEKVKSRAAQRPFGGSSLSLLSSLLGAFGLTQPARSIVFECVFMSGVLDRMDAGPVRISFHHSR